MSILDFHASKLYRQINTEGFTDENGDYHSGKVMWTFCCTCNVVPAGEANKIAIPDGSIDYYSYSVYNIPVGIKEFEYGELVKLNILGAKEVTLKVKGFHRYQLQCKLWV